jgi:hypothetical protein
MVAKLQRYPITKTHHTVLSCLFTVDASCVEPAPNASLAL